MECDFRFLTLNCWGVVPYITKKTERLSAIRKTLASGRYDIICLQEIWAESDYSLFKNELIKKYPYENYYHSNYIGSGCCIFSKFKIVDTFFVRYSVNGYAHRISHGDWFGGKGICLAKLELPKGFRLNVYFTHLHADYAELGSRDRYLAHRCSQTLEMLHFMQLTMRGCDAAILAGDMNSTPESITYQLITNFTGFRDAYLKQHKPPDNPDVEGTTCDRPDNSYTNVKILKKRPHGLRLDYIFFLNNAGCRFNCISCDLEMRKMEESKYNYSDHEGVAALMHVERHVLESGTSPAPHLTVNCLHDCKTVIQAGLEYCDKVRFRCIALLVLLLSILIFSIYYLVEEGTKRLPSPLVNTFLVILGAACFVLLWHTVIVRAAERKAYLNNLQSLRCMEMENVSRESVSDG